MSTLLRDGGKSNSARSASLVEVWQNLPICQSRGIHTRQRPTIQQISSRRSAYPRPQKPGICVNRPKINLSQVFAGQKVGIKQVSERLRY